MIKTGNECVGCPDDMGCIFEACPYYSVTRTYCDRCGEEEDLYYWDGDELCVSCILQQLRPVEYED